MLKVYKKILEQNKRTLLKVITFRSYFQIVITKSYDGKLICKILIYNQIVFGKSFPLTNVNGQVHIALERRFQLFFHHSLQVFKLCGNIAMLTFFWPCKFMMDTYSVFSVVKQYQFL